MTRLTQKLEAIWVAIREERESLLHVEKAARRFLEELPPSLLEEARVQRNSLWALEDHLNNLTENRLSHLNWDD